MLNQIPLELIEIIINKLSYADARKLLFINKYHYELQSIIRY